VDPTSRKQQEAGQVFTMKTIIAVLFGDVIKEINCRRLRRTGWFSHMDRRDIQKLKGKPEGGVPLEERNKNFKTILKDVLIKRHENFSGSLLRTRCKDYWWAAANLVTFRIQRREDSFHKLAP
jgi:hypothetical protein